jgi:RNA polymerase sigma factor (sigma-70 family)
MSAQKGVESFQGATESEFHAWLFGVYENTKKTLARRLSAQKRDYRRETDAHCDDGFAHIRSSRRSPLSSIISRENCDLVSEALGNLTTDQAEVVRLRFVDRQSLNEIAISMGKSQKAVSGLIYRATKALCVELSK